MKKIVARPDVLSRMVLRAVLDAARKGATTGRPELEARRAPSGRPLARQRTLRRFLVNAVMEEVASEADPRQASETQG